MNCPASNESLSDAALPEAEAGAQRLGPALVVFALSALLSIAVWRAAVMNQHDMEAQRFARLSERVTSILSERLSNYQKALSGAQGLYAASKSVERAEWRTYVNALDTEREFPGALGFGYVAFVRRPDLSAFIEITRKDESSWFQVLPAGESNDLMVVKYIEPQDRNLPALGRDLSQDPSRRAAFVRSMVTGEPSLTAKIGLIQDSAARPAFLYVYPVYRNGLPLRTEAERAAAIEGWVYAALVVESVMQGIVEATGGMIDFQVTDRTEPGGSSGLYRSASAVPGAASVEATFNTSSELHHAGRHWILRFVSRPEFDAATDRRMSHVLLAGGLMLSALLGLFIWSLTNARTQAVALATEMTRDLKAAESELRAKHAELKAGENRLRTILNSEPECVKLVAADGVLLEMNPAGLCMVEAESLDQVVGQSVYDLLVPEDKAMFRELNEAIFRGETRMAEFEIIGLKGTRRWMQTNACPLRDLEGRIVAHLAVTRDISGRKRSEAALEKANRELIDVSHRAGMAEVASGVLHNVGNVLNSVNVSATLLGDQVRKSPAVDLDRVAALLREQGANLSQFFTNDPRGPKVPEFLAQLAGKFTRLRAMQLEEVAALQRNVEHIKEIVAMQQSYAKISGVNENLRPAELIEDALRMNTGTFQKHEVELVREMEADLPMVCVDKHKVLQILFNLLGNAKHACDDAGRTGKRITVRASSENGCVRIAVTDNGVGILSENLSRLFNHGFTTRKDGHGFGLHSSANAAKAMGGRLTVHSDGAGRGATFTLELPPQPEPRNITPATSLPTLAA